MLEQAGDNHGTLSVTRRLAVLGYDALATFCGLFTALLIHQGAIHRQFTPPLRAAAALLVVIRIASVIASRSWNLRSRIDGEIGRLLLAMVAGSAIFVTVSPGLPRDVYALELFLSTSFMVAVRVALRSVESPRRALNVAAALLGLVVTSPLWVVIAVAIKLTSRGPVIYRQLRIGVDVRHTQPVATDPRRRQDLGGRPFMMLKFRTMTVDAEKSTGAVWSAAGDSRVTLVGRFLRHTRLDELPQFINVLKGDMNVVGPRPERPTIFAELRDRIPNYSIRQRERPGITGYAQVNLEYDSSIEDVVAKLQYDLEYVSHRSVTTDLAIMAKTVPVMLMRSRMLSRGAPLLGTRPPIRDDSHTVDPARSPVGSTAQIR